MPGLGKKKPVSCKASLLALDYASLMHTQDQKRNGTGKTVLQTASQQEPPVFLMAAACYLILANMYYAQPILLDMAADVGLAVDASGCVITMLQIGYALGILLLGPLGDVVENRKLIVGMTLGAGIGVALTAACHTIPFFLGFHLGIGIFSAATQVVIVFAVSLAPNHLRGRVLGMVTAGLFAGIVLARPTASLVSGLLGWRGLYLTSAIAMLLLAWTLWRQLPSLQPAASGMSYRATLSSLCTTAQSVPHLPVWLLLSSLSFAALTMFWTAAPLHLLYNRHLSHAELALFALVGLASPPCVVFAGRLLDRGRGFGLRLWGTGVATGAWLMAYANDGTVLLMLAALLLDHGVNVTTVSVQQAILAARPEARARCNALAVTANFCGGALGASLGPWLLGRYGWQAVALTGAFLLAIPFLLNVSLHAFKERP